MNMLGNLGVFLIGFGVGFIAIVATIEAVRDKRKKEMPKGTPPGSYEDDMEWDEDESTEEP